ncbi:maltose transporter permease [Endozoicomonas montiporae]|uniref:Maltose/maltodextrin transport system permease protein MalG n=2 Tax=Endozoicomonas montiporae TaxID=1027273 RepID=A0A081N8L0_9GAMM|nr:maltose ABC transporter permease MalG [Endozoicomonas montiporae]AMO55315.1 maltose transporter permease [Endozoicomonas montiporae CL-33]KEQ14783.1 maltose transporter permease [Endozoicomonas montiporae]
MIVQPRNLKYRVWAARIFMILFLCLIMFPFLMIISVSLRSGNFATGDLVPTNPSLEHWYLAFGIPWENADGSVIQPPFPVMLWLWNSIKVSFVSTILILLLSTTGAYAFARLRFKFKEHMLTAMMILQMFPAVLALVAIYSLFDKLGNYIPWLGLDSLGSVTVAYLGGLALHIWLIKGYFETIDQSLEEAAAIDGATPWQAFRYVLLPLSVPILAVVFILAFITSVAEYPVASVLLQSMDNLTLAVGSRQYLNPQNYLWGDFAAAAVLSGLPISIIFLLCQRWIVGGLTAGGVKG